MTTRANDAKCRTCGGPFKRTFARQQKCGSCRYSNVYNCAMCGNAYERCDDVRVCDSCLKALRPPVDSADIQDWDRHLALIGNGTSRGAAVGDSKIAYAHEFPTQAATDDSPDRIPSVFECIADGRPSAEDALIGDELLAWFLSASAYEVGKKLGIRYESVQSLRAEYLDVPRDEVQVALQVLGFPAHEWKKKKLGVALVRAKADAMRRSLEAQAA